MIKLNLGCGSVRPTGWINTDSSLNAHLQRIPIVGTLITRLFNKVKYDSNNLVYMNLNTSWNYENNSIDIVYASHLFEHLSLKSADLFMKEAYRCLKPGGVIRIVVPDLYQIALQYIEEFNATTNGDPTKFIMWAINMHREGQYGSPSFFKRIIYELQGYPHQHKFMYDSKSLTSVFNNHGFRNINAMSYGNSKLINEIADVEGTKESYLSVYLEAQK